MGNRRAVEKIPDAEANPAAADDPAILERALNALEGDDKVGHAATGLGTAAGVATGVSVAGAVAGAVGASTLLGSSTLATVLGGVLVTATPVGWVIGCAAVGGAAAYGIARLVRSGGRSDQIRKDMRNRISKRLKSLKASVGNDGAESELEGMIASALTQGLLDQDGADRIREAVAGGALTTKVATDRLDRVLKQASQRAVESTTQTR